jgi:hypothetical protein
MYNGQAPNERSLYQCQLFLVAVVVLLAVSVALALAAAAAAAVLVLLLVAEIAAAKSTMQFSLAVNGKNWVLSGYIHCI